MNHRLVNSSVVIIAVTLGLSAQRPALAQSYPSRPVTIIVPYGPGGNADLAARALAFAVQKQKAVTQPLIVVNKTGAGGIVGTQFVVQGPKDGYTLLLARVGSQVVAPALDPATPYKWDGLTAIGLIETDPYVCVVAKNSRYSTIQELFAAIKAKPGKLSYASTGNMDASVVFPVKAFLNLGLSADAALKIPFKGAADTVVAVLGGQVDFACNALAPYIGGLQAGTLKALFVSTRSRIPEAPNTPTVEEIGMKNLEMVSGWSALYGPPNLPQDVVQKWADVLVATKNDPEWTGQVRRRGTLPTVMSPEDTQRFVEGQYNEYRALSPYIGVDK
jgi:tripartite-type tricarboxylate transporter receptor subunit TctC